MVRSHARRRARERHEQAVRDLLELDEQVAREELSHERAAILRDRFEVEAAAALAWLDAHPSSDGEVVEQADKEDARQGQRFWSPRRLLGAGGAVAVLVGVGATVVAGVEPRPPGGFVTGNEAAANSGRDLSQVTNAEMEQVVADNSDIVPMRLRLAHRYLDDEEYDKAVDHYLEVLDRAPDPEAMSHLGWLLFLDGEAELASELVETSLQRRPDETEALWFLANIRLYGQERPADAVPLLEQLLRRSDLGTQRDDVTRAMDDAMAALEDAG